MNFKKLLAFTLLTVISISNLEIKTKANISTNYTVSSDKIGSEQVGSLQHAIANAKDGDTIILGNGIYDVTETNNKGSFFVIKQNNLTIKAKELIPNVIITGKALDNSAYDGGDISSQDTILISGNNVKIDGLTVTPLLDMKNDPLVFKNSIKVSDLNFTQIGVDFTEFEMQNCKIKPNVLYPNYGGKVFLDISKSKDASKILLKNNNFKNSTLEIRTPATLNKNTFVGETKEATSILIKNQPVDNPYNIVLSDNTFTSIPDKQKAIDINSEVKLNFKDNKVNNTMISSGVNPFIGNKKNALMTFQNTVATVIFETNGGTKIEPQIIAIGSPIPKPNTIKAGFIFNNWYSDMEFKNIFDFSTLITSDQTLYAKWDAIVTDNTVTFNTNGGSIINNQSVPPGNPVSKPINPTKSGYDFSGWYLDENLATSFDFNTIITSNTTLYAKWDLTIPNVTVTFNSNGGSAVSAKTVKSGESISAPDIPLRSGFVFANWYTDQAFEYRYDFANKVTSNIVIYAKWDEIITNVTVAFNSNGGSTVPSKTVKYNEIISAPTIPTKPGYTFINWYTDTNFNYLYNFNNKVTTNITLYAKWEAVTNVTVAFNSNGGSAVPSKTVKYNETITAPTIPTKPGYTFINWYSDTNFNYLYNFNNKVTSNMTLYAKWQSVTNVTVTFNTNGGSSVYSKTVKYNDYVSAPTSPTKAGYSFDGWYTSSALNYKYNFDTYVTSNITLYAKWSLSYNYNTVTFVSNGGSERDSITVKYGQSISSPTKPTRTGYIFDGWYRNSSLTQEYIFSDAVTQNITLYAKWVSEKDVLAVDFRSNGGNYINSIQVNYGNKITKPIDPKKDNYTFSGWYTDYELRNSFDFNTLIKENITLYAKWASSVYTVSFDSRGGSYVAPKYPNYNEKISQPTDPTLSGYRFLGWYKDSGGLNKFDFSQVITGNITIYAKWELIPTNTKPPIEEITYSDVPKTHWAYDAIYSLTKRGILEGQSVMRFVPEKDLTRAEFASILTKAFELSEKSGTKNYTDVKSNDWFYKYVKIVTSNSIYSGYDNGTFKPNKPINREEMAVVIYRIFNLKGFSINKTRDGNVSDLYNATFGKEAITYLYQRGIVNGDNNKYMPSKNSTRAEASMIIYNLINKLEK